MEKIIFFIKGVKSQTHVLLDASAWGTIRSMTKPQIKDLIKNMCLNEYCSKSDKSVKFENVGTPKGMLAVDTHVALLVQIELLTKKIVESSLSKANVSQVQARRCDLYGGGHENERWSLEGSSEEA